MIDLRKDFDKLKEAILQKHLKNDLTTSDLNAMLKYIHGMGYTLGRLEGEEMCEKQQTMPTHIHLDLRNL